MPFHVPPVDDEREGLAGYLAQQQDAFRCVVFGLTDEQAGLAPTAGTLTLGGLLKHVTWVQGGWLEQVLCAPEPVPPRGEETYRAHQEAWTWTAGDALPRASEAYDAICARVLDAVGTVDLDVAVPVPPAPWNPRDVDHWSVRWVWLHLIEELARHAGHADIVRESVDGATTYELVAARDGLPETPWLKPWRPGDG
ncbi:MAG: hypothetical protein QOK15_2757 [Nocardioidaceae bacterium]|jgi:hypothetical protein|nr:hypothetical protein [Nocardioidaceae bacterium]